MKLHSHIAVLAFPFGTHAAPLLTLVRRLAEASSPGTRFSFFNTAVSNSALFSSDDHKGDKVKVYEVCDGVPKDDGGFVNNVSHFEAIRLFLDASPGNFEKAIEEAEKETGLKISCLITDAFLWFACDMAEKRGISWVPFWTAASCSLTAHVHTDVITDAVKSSTEIEVEDKEVSCIPGLSKVRFGDLPPEIFVDKNPSPLSHLIYNMVQKLPKSNSIVLNSFEEIDPIITKDLKSKFQHFLNVGPSIVASPATVPNPNDDRDQCISFLESQSRAKSVVYISFGTVICPPENELHALAKALESSNTPFLWSLNERAQSSLPDGFIDRTSGFGKIVSWAPQLRVLAHGNVGVFITHCGWNSILESVCSGVPMICRPFFGDQKLNARMVQDVWEIGLRVEGGVFTENGMIEEALNTVMSGERGKVIRDNVNGLKEKAYDAVKSEGSSSRNFDKLLEIIGAKIGN